MDPKLVLAISGGGSRGIMPATILDLIQSELGVSIAKFDLVVGTSAGAILSMYATANPGPLAELFSVSNLEHMCDKSLWDRTMGVVQFSPVYNGVGKRQLLQQYFGDRTMGEWSPHHIAMPVYNLYQKQTEICTTYLESQKNLKVVDVLNAATAAAPYFPPVFLKESLYVDGGFAANDPLLLAYTEARELFGPDCPIRLLALGTGRQIPNNVYKAEPIREWGAIQWVQNSLVELLMSAPMDLEVDNLQRIMKLDSPHNRVLWINPDIDTRFTLDCTDPIDLATLATLAANSFRKHQPDLVHFFHTENCPQWETVMRTRF